MRSWGRQVARAAHSRNLHAFGDCSIVLHDAGAAAHALAWLKSNVKWRAWCKIFAGGPALEILEGSALNLEIISRPYQPSRAWLLVGTGWQSNMEVAAMEAAHRASVPTIAIVDHWANYAARFSGLHPTVRPRWVAVTDSHAQAVARTQLPWATPLLWPHDLVTQTSVQVRHIGYDKSQGPPTLLWVDEPLRLDGQALSPLANPVLRPLLASVLMNAIAKHSIRRVRVRAHPSSVMHGFEGVSEGLLGDRVEVEVYSAMSTVLERDLAESTIVMGIHSYGLYLAHRAGIPTRTVTGILGLPDFFPPKTVPQAAM